MKTFADKCFGDCSKSVAYSLNFTQMCYGYDNIFWGDYFDSICPHSEDLSIQKLDYECPKSGFSKKDYYILDICQYGVSEKLKSELIEFGIAKENFRPIYTKKHDVLLGWQITPIQTLPPTYMINGFKKICVCSECEYYEYESGIGLDEFHLYNDCGYPDFITEEALEVLNSVSLASTSDKLSVYISLNLYNYLIEKYPRMECRPVFLGRLEDDPEYKKYHKLL